MGNDQSRREQHSICDQSSWRVSYANLPPVHKYCITPIFRVEFNFAIFANFDFARHFPPAKIISTASGISRNFPPAKFYSREFFLHAKKNTNINTP